MATTPHPERLGQLAIELSVASERLRARWRHELGVSAYEMLAITHLADAGRLTIGALGTRLALSSGAMTGLVDRLERDGRIARVRDEQDRRRVHLAITDATRIELDRLSKPVRDRIAALPATPAPPEDLLRRLLACYAETMEEDA